MDILVISLVTFMTIMLVIVGVYFTMTAVKESPKSEVRRRLNAIALRMPTDQDMPRLLKNQLMSEIPAIHKILFRLKTAQLAEKLLDQADVRIKVSTLILIVVSLFIFGLLGGMLVHRGVIFSLVLAVVLAVSPVVYLVHKKNQRVKKFVELFPNALDMIARSLRAGHSFQSAMQVVYEEMPEPLSKVFRIAYDEQNLGLSLQESLNNMSERINSIDLNFFVTAVTIQRETGGNLSETLEKLATTIRERFKILGQLRVYTAQGRMSGYLLALLPIVLAVVIWFIHPAYMMVLFKTKLGIYMILTAVFMQLMGFFVIRKIINITI